MTVAKQAPCKPVTDQSIMRSGAFRRGVEEYRAGRRFDDTYNDWNYERGRQWAAIAPRDLPVFIGRRINPAALRLMRGNAVL
jgi:hypothetical protein